MKRILIPLDLKPLDIIVDNHGVNHEFLSYYDGKCYINVSGGMFKRNGYRYFREMGYAVKIIRYNCESFKKNSKKTNTDPIELEYDK